MSETLTNIVILASSTAIFFCAYWMKRTLENLNDIKKLLEQINENSKLK